MNVLVGSDGAAAVGVLKPVSNNAMITANLIPATLCRRSLNDALDSTAVPKQRVFVRRIIRICFAALAWVVICTAVIIPGAASAPHSTAHAQPAVTPSATSANEREPWIVPGQRYYFPVQPPSIARYARVHHDYPATDIFVPVGSIVVAVTDGVVDEVSRVDRWDRRTNDGAMRGGLWATIIGDDGIRYHASHLSAIEPGVDVGTQVYAGQTIGRSGKTGNAAATPPHVHFGISRPTFPGDWIVRRGQVWPYRYLKAWTRGEDLTPALPAALD